MKKSITDFLVPIYGPINALVKANQESEKNLRKSLRGEMSNLEFTMREIEGTSYVFICGTVSTLGLYYILDKIIR